MDIVVTITNNTYGVNLTDGHIAYSKRSFRSEQRAIAYVQELQERGHKVHRYSCDNFRLLLKLAGGSGA